MAYRIEFRPAALRNLKSFDPSIAPRLLADIELLAGNPRPPGIERLKGKEKLYRLRIGPGRNYRVVFQIHDQDLLILVVKVGDRKDVYRRM